jgi:hypothetical protein
MLSREPLNEQERRHLRALQLVFELSDDPRHEEAAKHLEELPPNAQRHMINLYHVALDDEEAFYFAIKVAAWLAAILAPFFWLCELFQKLFRR